MRQLAGVADGRDTPAKRGGLCAVARLSRREGRRRLRTCRQRGNTLCLAPEFDLVDFDAKAPPPKTSAFWDIVSAGGRRKIPKWPM
jgi:hypothetical protein